MPSWSLLRHCNVMLHNCLLYRKESLGLLPFIQCCLIEHYTPLYIFGEYRIPSALCRWKHFLYSIKITHFGVNNFSKEHKWNRNGLSAVMAARAAYSRNQPGVQLVENGQRRLCGQQGFAGSTFQTNMWAKTTQRLHITEGSLIQGPVWQLRTDAVSNLLTNVSAALNDNFCNIIYVN